MINFFSNILDFIHASQVSRMILLDLGANELNKALHGNSNPT